MPIILVGVNGNYRNKARKGGNWHLLPRRDLAACSVSLSASPHHTLSTPASTNTATLLGLWRAYALAEATELVTGAAGLAFLTLKPASSWPRETASSQGVAMEMCSGTRKQWSKAFQESWRLGNGRFDVCSQSLLQLLFALNSFSMFLRSPVDMEAESVDCRLEALQRAGEI